MNIRLNFIAVIVSLGFIGNAWAQSITVPTTAVAKGDTGTVNLAFTAGGAATNLDFIIAYDETVVDEAAAAIDCSTTIPQLTALNCSVNTVANEIRGIGVNLSTTPLESTDPFAVMSLPVLAGAATGDSVQAFVANFFDAGGTSVGQQNDTWTLTVTDGPQADWSSAPNSATGFDFGSHTTNTGAYAQDLVVTNTGADGSTLTGDCAITGNPAFSIPGDNTLGTGLALNEQGIITVQCDTTSVIPGLITGLMTCTHNGDGTTEISPTDYDLACNVTATPEPAFLGVDSGLNAMDVPEQGDPDATATLTVSNNGDAATTLIGECVYAGDTEITVTGGSFAIAQGSAPVDVTATCSGAAEGTYAGTLTCGPTDPQTWVAADSPYAVGCTVGPPGDAVYESAPVTGSTIDMTPPGSPVVEGTTIPTQDLVITNNAPEADDRDLDLLLCGLTSMTSISATSVVTPLAQGASTTVTFSCDSTTAGVSNDTYSCDYDVDGDGASDGTATYPVNCEVRVAESDVVLTPPDGSTLTITVPTAGTGQASIFFRETSDEGEDGTLTSCSLADTTNFSILEPASFPADIPSGGSLRVLIEGRATDDGEPASTTLSCTYSDSNVTDQLVTYTVGVVTRDIPIPTLSTWGLSLMILTLLGLGGIVIRRRVVI